jgi:hypothetical protein
MIGPTWGGDSLDVSMFNLNSDIGLPINNPRVEDSFKITMMVYYNGKLIKNINFISSSLTQEKSYIEETINPNIWHNVFVLKAPKIPGKYLCTFEGFDSSGNKYTFNKEINVEENKYNLFDARDIMSTMSFIGAIAFIGLLIIWGVNAAKQGKL